VTNDNAKLQQIAGSSAADNHRNGGFQHLHLHLRPTQFGVAEEVAIHQKVFVCTLSAMAITE
jgi:hypothetical protein